MAKKELRLSAEAKNEMASAIQEFLAERDPSITSQQWYEPQTPEAYGRKERYARLIRALPSRILHDIEYKVSTSIHESLKSREDEVAKREAALKLSAEEDRKRDDALIKREHEVADKLRGKEAALALGEAEMARFRAQMQAESVIYREYPHHRMPFGLIPWGSY